MNIAGALAITGGIFTVVAMVLGTVAGELYGRTGRQLLIISGVAFALAVGFCFAAVWAAVVWTAALT